MAIQITSDLWSFANQFYEDENIRHRCLDLQDLYDASVDVILWLCWLHANGIELERVALTQARNVVGGVNQRMLSSLRDLRIELQAGNCFTRVQEQLIRKHLLNAELSIEKILLQRLQDLTSRLPLEQSSEEALSLFDYFSALSVDHAGEEAAFFVERIHAQKEQDRELLSV